jgi:hypothetical protein
MPLISSFDTKSDLTRVCVALGVPATFFTSRHERFTGDEALAILLSRLAYPCCLFDLHLRWGRSTTSLSCCINELGDHLFLRWKHLFEFRPSFHSPERLSHYATCIAAAGSPIKDIWGFIDGTFVGICHPQEDQGAAYNGHKKHHGLKFQAVITPDGLLAPVFGPVEGRRADGGVLEMSKLEDICRSHAHRPDGGQLFLYGDPAYGVSDTILSGVHRVGDLSEQERTFNYSMSQLRQSVEWGFGHVVNTFGFVDYDKGLKVGLQPVGKLYLLAILFTNIRTILYGSKVSHKFQCSPPTLEQFLVPETSV